MIYDIIIIGCGLVGGSLALTLPKSLSIAIIDAESPMQKQPGYLALNSASCSILKDFGVWERIVAHTTPTPLKAIYISELHQPADQCLLRAEDMGSAVLGYLTSTTAIRETLLQHIQSSDHITLYAPQRVEVITWPDEGIESVAVTLDNAAILQAKLIIMADGGRSPLRTQLGFAIQEDESNHVIVITQLNTHKPHHCRAFERFTTEGPIALLPINQEEYILVWTMQQAHVADFLALTSEALIKKLSTAYDNSAIIQWQETGQRKSYPIARSYVKTPYKTRLVLMGNAAHTVHPVGAQGFNLSLQDAALLSDTIQTAVENQQDIGSERLLQRYAAERADDIDFVRYFTQFLLKAFSHDAPVLQKLRSLGLRMIDQCLPIKQAILKKTAEKSPTRSRALPPFAKGAKSEYDIIILGNRLIGSALACALDSRYRIAVLDKAPTPTLPVGDYSLRINAYNRASETLLRALGVWKTLPPERCFAFDKIFARSASDANENNALSFNANMLGESHLGHFIENDLVTYYLHEKIKKLSNIDFFDDAAVQAIIPSADNVRIITQEQRIFSAKLLAACDGGNSIARQLLGIDVQRHPYYQRCIVSNIFFDGELDKTAWQCFLKTGPIGLLPLAPGVCSLAWSCDNDVAAKLLLLEDDAFMQQLDQATCGRLGKILRVTPRQAFPLIAQHAEQYSAQRTLLLGDAAHTIHPLAGLGANLGFQDVLAVVKLLNDPKTSARDIGRRYILDAYERLRRRQNSRVMHMMTLFNTLFHQDNALLNPLGNLSLRLANHITPAKKAMFQQAMWMGTSPAEILSHLRT